MVIVLLVVLLIVLLIIIIIIILTPSKFDHKTFNSCYRYNIITLSRLEYTSDVSASLLTLVVSFTILTTSPVLMLILLLILPSATSTSFFLYTEMIK
ncbi:MAG: hypothetical protein ACI8RD_007804 [Bacillariaceae sp.]|jgi:hypothetical protein